MSGQRHRLTPIIVLGLTYAYLLPTTVRAQTECPNIACGQSIQDEIQIPGDQNCLTFSNTGQHSVSVYLGSEADGTLLLSVTAPDGQVQDCDTFFGSCELDLTILQTGTYVATVDGSGGATGDYTLTFNCLETDQTPIGCGDFRIETITPAGDEDYYTFENAGPTPVSIYLGSEASGTLVLTITAPDGQFRDCDTFFGSCELELSIGQTGTYVVTVDGAGGATGDYTLSFNCVGRGEQVICPGESLDGELRHAGDEHYFVFDGVAGESVAMFLDSQADGVLLLRLTAPDGTEWSCDTFFGSCEINESLSIDGSYLVTVDGSGGAAGGYSLSFSCLELCPPCEPGFAISSVRPNRGGDGGEITVRIVGRNIQEGARARLTRSDENDIEAIAHVVSLSGNSLTAVFDLEGQRQGQWDIVVTNPDGQVAILPIGFTIEPSRGPEIWVDILGPGVVRVGIPAVYSVFVGNSGNNDGFGVPVWIAGVPLSADVDPLFELGVVPAPTGGASPNLEPFIERANQKVFALWLPVVRAQQFQTLRFALTLQDSGPVQLRVLTTSRWLTSPDLAASAANCISEILSEGMAHYIGDEAAEIIQGCSGAILNGIATVMSELAQGVSSGQQLDTYSQVDIMLAALKAAATCFAQELQDVGLETIARALVSEQFDFIEDLISGAEVALACAPFLADLGGILFDLLGATSFDPNEKVGSVGFGTNRYVSGKQPLKYLIQFENLASATAPAQEVVVRDQLDAELVELSTLGFGLITAMNKTLIPETEGDEITGDIDLRPEHDMIARISGNLDTTGSLTWTLTSIDPATGQVPSDPLAGFLPPNVNPPEGEGSVVFTVMPKANLPTGTVIRNRATITFDTNAPIETGEWINTIDNNKPESRVEPLGPFDAFPIEVRWSGTDEGAGLRDYTIYSSTDDGPFEVWLANTTETTAMFQGGTDHEYSFYSIARDHVGNVEVPPVSPDAEITVGGVPANPIGGMCGSGACGAGSASAMILSVWWLAGAKLARRPRAQVKNRF